MKITSKKRKRLHRRSGTTMVEFAIVAPILFLFFFAAFEFCRVAMIRHTVDNAVYEGCRTGIVPGSTASESQQTATQLLATLGITQASIDVFPAAFDADTEEVRVTITVPLDQNTFIPPAFVDGKSITRELTMRREGS